MKCNVAKWGNSYAIRIPKDIVDEFELHENSSLELERNKEQIILKPSKEHDLRKLLAKVKPQNEIDWGEARGKEFW